MANGVPLLSEERSRAGSALDRVLHGFRTDILRLEPRERRLQGWELLVVLSIFPLASAIAALASLTSYLEYGAPYVRTPTFGLGGTWPALGFDLALVLSDLCGAALVLYLLARSGEGSGAINLDRRGWRIDAALLLPLFMAVFFLTFWLGDSIMSWLGIHAILGYGGSSLGRPGAFAVDIARSVSAGFLEEIVVLGFLVRRLRSRGLPIVAIVLIDVAVRVSYHVYYGYGVIPIAIWALVSVLLYLRIQRLWPFIICHIAYDTGQSWRYLYHHGYVIAAITAAIIGGFMTLRWARWAPAVSPDAAGVQLAGADGQLVDDDPDWWT